MLEKYIWLIQTFCSEADLLFGVCHCVCLCFITRRGKKRRPSDRWTYRSTFTCPRVRVHVFTFPCSRVLYRVTLRMFHSNTENSSRFAGRTAVVLCSSGLKGINNDKTSVGLALDCNKTTLTLRYLWGPRLRPAPASGAGLRPQAGGLS